MFSSRTGSGPPLVLVHGLGSNHTTWNPIVGQLAAHREVVAIDLPGHGHSPALSTNTIATFTTELVEFLRDNDLAHADLVGSSVGGRLVLELARRGHDGAVVALDPGGFWSRGGARFLGLTLAASVRLVRLLRPVAAPLARNRITRTALFAQLSAAPWRLDGDQALAELRSIAGTVVFDEVLSDLVHGPTQGAMARGAAKHPIVIGWGRRDHLTLPRQAKCACQRYPDARLVWFEGSGHFPHLDKPAETARLILDTVAKVHHSTG